MKRGGGRVQRGVRRCLLLHGQASVARAQLAAGVGAECTANATNNETRRRTHRWTYGVTLSYLRRAALGRRRDSHAQGRTERDQPSTPNDSKGTGTADVSYDTTSKNLTWTITYSGLTGDATAAHFHGPADTDKTAGIAVPITGDLKSSVKGSATLTDAQAADLLAGRYYLNIHTAAHRPGEVRGQVTGAK